MMQEQCGCQCLERPVKGFWPSLGVLLQRWGKRLERWAELARTRRQLREMDTRLLKDIGLSRADVERIAGKPFWEDPRESGEELDWRYRH